MRQPRTRSSPCLASRPSDAVRGGRLGPGASRRTAFRKLKDLDARTSYSHRVSYYTLDALADFDERGLWSFAGVRFSRAGTLLATAESFVGRRGRTLRRRVGQPARCRHPGPAAQARRRRAADAAQTRRPVPLLRGRPRAPDAPTARAAPVDGHARTRTAPARADLMPEELRAAVVLFASARRAAAASVRRPRSAQVRVGRRPAHRRTARHRPVDGRRRPAATRRARRRDRPGAARRRRASADEKKRRKSTPTSKL